MNLGVVESNMKAVRLYKKLNFAIEGQLIKHISINDNFVSVLRMFLFNKNYIVK